MIPKFIAFYLPQFHPIPENDEWWGPGFTEWRLTEAAKPLFPGHHQPHRPLGLNYIDLRRPLDRLSQAVQASSNGIDAFCYYHYWFKGRRLLDHPFADVLHSGFPDFPFCLCWANESWSRRFDGNNKHVLIRQTYSHEDDQCHIEWLCKAFQDSRYLRVNGKPLLLIYRARSLPAATSTLAIWRDVTRRKGIGELMICAVESNFREERSRTNLSDGFDATVEFQPDIFQTTRLKALWTTFFSKDCGRTIRCLLRRSQLRSYPQLAETALRKPSPSYRRYPCVTPSWDNTTRRPKGGALLYNEATPASYQRWLTTVALREAARRDDGLVFINAWNEWSEGSHLEPDQWHGMDFLNATAMAKSAVIASSQRQRQPPLMADNVQSSHN